MKTSVLFFIAVSSLFLSLNLRAQVVSFEGVSEQLNDSQNSLECRPINLNKSARIVEISGNNAGFWIEKQNLGTVLQFSDENDQEAIEKTLTPGTYWVYPKIKNKEKQAIVQIILAYQ